LVNWSELEVLAFATLCESLNELAPLMILFGLPHGNKIIDEEDSYDINLPCLMGTKICIYQVSTM
jgi:hypothetical protein